jgi:hypothetical protein
MCTPCGGVSLGEQGGAEGSDPLPKHVGSKQIMGHRAVDKRESVSPAAINFRTTRLKAESDELQERRLASGPG